MPKKSARRAEHEARAEGWRTFQSQLQRDSLITLLDLAHEDLDALASGKQQHLLSAVRGFAGHVGMLVDPTGESNVVTDVPNLSLKAVRILQRGLRDGLDKLYPREGGAAPLQWQPELTVDSIEIARGTNAFGLIYCVAWPDAFWFATLKLLEHHGAKVRRCLRCGRLYLRTKRQEYCTTACSQRARSQRWYERHRDDVLERRHKSYLAAHPKRKVPRRKRIDQRHDRARVK